MANQNGTFSAADLDLSGIPGIEGLDIPGVNAPAPVDNGDSGADGAPPAAPQEPSAPVDYSQYTENPQGSGAVEPQQPASTEQPGLWDHLLSQVPEVLHSELQPTLSEYERQLQRRGALGGDLDPVTLTQQPGDQGQVGWRIVDCEDGLTGEVGGLHRYDYSIEGHTNVLPPIAKRIILTANAGCYGFFSIVFRPCLISALSSR